MDQLTVVLKFGDLLMFKGEKMSEFFYFDENYKEKAQWCNENNCFIQEVEKDENGRRFQIVKNAEQDISQLLRDEREVVCFPIINRGKLWYDMLDDQQQSQLRDWYLKWLDAPQTKVRPKDLQWLK